MEQVHQNKALPSLKQAFNAADVVHMFDRLIERIKNVQTQADWELRLNPSLNLTGPAQERMNALNAYAGRISILKENTHRIYRYMQVTAPSY